MWVLLGVAALALGFALRINPLLVVAVAAGTTGLAAGLSPVQVLEAFGKAFKENRFISAIWIILALIGVLEREGLQAWARQVISRAKAATAGRVLLMYLFARQISSALGLTALGGHPQMVRPLIAPMAERAAENAATEPLPEQARQDVRAMAAATDNVGLFFGEDIFIAIGSILLIKGFLGQSGFDVQPLDLAMWAIPTAALAFLIHGTRLWLFDGRLRRTNRRGKP
jgi:uncharacterized membrane protein